jgi:hypothetical protein
MGDPTENAKANNASRVIRPDHMSREDFATLCRIVGVQDPGMDVSRMEITIDWLGQRIETRFTYPAFARG